MKQFIDVVNFEIEAGHGGAGCVSFRREAHVPMGGPDGGNGGDGGDVIVIVDARINSFGKIKSRKKFKARDGESGRARLSDGKKGDNVIIRVPIGTVIYNEETENIIADLTEDGQSETIARGGKGGKGNKFYATSTNQAPDYAQHGLDGDKLNIRLEVKLIADIGLVGMPNAGKSSLLARLTRANPKIASYPFTTLTPNLGVCYLDYERSFIIADIPGIIEGASEGAGLGLTFLRHIERTGALVFVIDITDEDINETYLKLRKELKLYSKELIKKKSIIILNKTDMLEKKEIEEKIKSVKKIINKEYKNNKENYFETPEVFAISVFSLDGEELEKITNALYKANELRYFETKKNYKEPLLLNNKKLKTKRVFGPVLSKRLGNSLGIDVIPHKTCSYNCIYCQLGSEENTITDLTNYYSVDEIIYELKEALLNNKNIDYITFTGSGEPTLYKDLKKLIYEIKQITDIPVCIITNGSLLYKQEMRSNLLLADLIIPSLDAGNEETFKLIDNPNKEIDFDKMVEGLIEFKKVFKGEYWLEIFLLKDINDNEDELDDIIKIVKKIKPDRIQLITATRRVANEKAKALSDEELKKIKKYFNLKCDIEIDIPNISENHKGNTRILTEEDIVNFLIRQPDTAYIIAKSFNENERKIKELLDLLIKKNKVREEIVNGVISYAVNI
ncbi:GTPase ObgE [Brachyspira aalborgi]|uniref:GTPase ObgE n=1 Tax=Brachyspira aalborgi TaxID=29522 RepID=UPI0011CAAD60|nr:GTPase ObgE [Brachyspira aalborgi]TXJ15947.1 GTPase ObgE [Brachyspira aalborgi]TXJ19448.1 GTPase ObgE [Brachyspira aalborgi]TXJ48750.1 GTPase ObgE [Brachyspira aalborgi]